METEVLARLGETSGFYTTTEIDQWLNDGQDDIAIAVEPLVATATAAAVANQAEYAVPSDTITIKQVHYGGSGSWVLLSEATYEDLFEKVADWEDSTVGGTATTPPSHWYWRSSTIGLYPKPSGSLSAGIRMLYSYRPASMSSGSATSGLPDWCDRAIVQYAVYRCRSKEKGVAVLSVANKDWQEYQRLLGQIARRFQKQRKEQAPRLVPDTDSYRGFYSRTQFPVERVDAD